MITAGKTSKSVAGHLFMDVETLTDGRLDDSPNGKENTIRESLPANLGSTGDSNNHCDASEQEDDGKTELLAECEADFPEHMERKQHYYVTTLQSI